MNWSLVGSFYGRSSIAIAHFVPIRQQTWPPQAILVSGWSISKNLLLWKPLGQIKQNIKGSIYGRSSITFPHFIPIGQKTWSQWLIHVSDGLKFKKSSLLKLWGTMNCYFVGIIYGRSCTKFPYFVPIIQLIATLGSSCLWLAN